MVWAPMTASGAVRRWSVLALAVIGGVISCDRGADRVVTPPSRARDIGPGDSGRFGGPDAASLDSGLTNADVGPAADAGTTGDAGFAGDAGPVADGAAGHDASVGQDAGPTADAGLAVDAGIGADAAAPMDGGPATPDGGAAGCVFGGMAAPARLDPRAPISADRLDDLTACVAADPGNAGALVDAFLEEHATAGWGATPWRNGTAFVLHRGSAADLTVSGSFDSWPTPGIRGFRNIPGTDLHVAEIPVDATARHQYKLTRGTGGAVDWSNNPLDPWVTWDGINRSGVGDFNNEIAGPNHVPATSFVHRRAVARRDVFLQLPLAYLDGQTGFGTLYVHDGNESLTRANMQAVTDTTIAAGRAQPVVVVYVALETQNVRISEYTYGPGTTGDAYVDFLADTLVPLIEANVPTATMPDNRGLAGASLGGLISFHGAWRRPDAFRRIGGQSSSLWFENQEMVTRFATGAVMDFRVYLDAGEDNLTGTQAMAQVLNDRGYDYLFVYDAGAVHEWPFWEARWDELLEFLY